MASNGALAKLLDEMAKMLEVLGEDSFRASAHARASRAVDGLAQAATGMDRAALLAVDGVGPKMADKILEYARTGGIAEHAALRARVPAGLLEVLEIPGLGPKTVHAMWSQLGVTDVASLSRAIEDGSLRTLPRMGEKAVEKIRAGVAMLATAQKRLRLGQATPIAEALVARVLSHASVARAQAAGSLRRGKETVGDIDILIALKPGKERDAPGVMEFFRATPGVARVLAAGDSKSSVMVSLNLDEARWEDGSAAGGAGGGRGRTIQVDARVVAASSFGAALQYFTGSKEHNVALRGIAQRRGLTLNEWGLFKDEEWDAHQARAKGATDVEGRIASGLPTALAGEDEAGIYAALGIACPPPELRENRGELSMGPGQGPTLIEVGDIKSELHAHTTASDGDLSIEELAREAARRGFHTIAVTDHSQSSTIANGLRPDRLRRHIDAVRGAHERLHKELGITILAGSEVDILADGGLDYDDELLALLDVVVASPHAALAQEASVATARLLRAIRHPLVHILGHPTGRLIDRRAGLSPEMGELFAAAKEHGVALEVNAHWMRLDLRDVHVAEAARAGCLVAIDCDVHQREDYDNLRYGVSTARRGWLSREQCVNAWAAGKLHAWLRGKR
jgi:DNA polymerase (family 10)